MGINLKSSSEAVLILNFVTLVAKNGTIKYAGLDWGRIVIALLPDNTICSVDFQKACKNLSEAQSYFNACKLMFSQKYGDTISAPIDDRTIVWTDKTTEAVVSYGYSSNDYYVASVMYKSPSLVEKARMEMANEADI